MGCWHPSACLSNMQELDQDCCAWHWGTNAGPGNASVNNNDNNRRYQPVSGQFFSFAKVVPTIDTCIPKSRYDEYLIVRSQLVKSAITTTCGNCVTGIQTRETAGEEALMRKGPIHQWFPQRGTWLDALHAVHWMAFGDRCQYFPHVEVIPKARSSCKTVCRDAFSHTSSMF